MDFSKNIKFDNNLIVGKSSQITYSGFLFQDKSDSVTIIYGFDDDWKETSAKEMKKTDKGFVITLEMLNYNSFNFCFRNSNYQWDNNYGQNYSSGIEPAPVVNEEKVIQNIENIELVETENEPLIVEENTNEETIQFENNNEVTNNVENIINDPLQSFEIDIEKDEPLIMEGTVVNSNEVFSLSNDIDSIFDELYTQEENIEENQQPIQENNTLQIEQPIQKNAETNNVVDNNVVLPENNNEFSMNSLIDEILSPIISSSVFEEENIKEKNDNFSDNVLDDEKNDNHINNLIDVLITDLYKKIDNTNISVEEKQDILNQVNNPQIEEVVEPRINVEQKVEEPIEIIDDSTEESLLDNVSELDNITEELLKRDEEKTKALTVQPRSLSRFDVFKKKIKLAFCKFFRISQKDDIASNL